MRSDRGHSHYVNAESALEIYTGRSAKGTGEPLEVGGMGDFCGAVGE